MIYSKMEAGESSAKRVTNNGELFVIKVTGKRLVILMTCCILVGMNIMYNSYQTKTIKEYETKTAQLELELQSLQHEFQEYKINNAFIRDNVN